MNQRRAHARIRTDHATELAEDYVEAIAELLDSHGVCRATDLAARFVVSHVTVNRTLGRLIRDGYVESQPYGPVFLTAKGKRLARMAKDRHQIVLNFLMAIGVDEATAIVDSEGIEHHVSDVTLRAMQSLIDRQGVGDQATRHDENRSN